jgi:hypothetical protein
MARVRVGPLSYGPKRGQRGIHAGPFSASYNVNNPVFGAFMLLVVIVAIVKAFWPYLLAAAAALVLILVLTRGLRAEHAAAAKKQRELQVQQWLRSPPPPLPLPGRFTDNWFAANVPSLHPGQVPVLLAEMRARGWTNQRIAQRVGLYLHQNPFYNG